MIGGGWGREGGEAVISLFSCYRARLGTCVVINGARLVTKVDRSHKTRGRRWLFSCCRSSRLARLRSGGVRHTCMVMMVVMMQCSQYRVSSRDRQFDLIGEEQK